MDAVIGRGPQRAWLEEAVAEAATGRGSLVLLGGDAGVGKTRLVEEVASTAHGTFLRGAARPSSPPYCSVVSALRRYLQKLPDGLEGCGPLRGHLALLLPELGEAVGEGDRGTLFEAIRCSLAAIAARRPAVVLLDDLQWSDEATLELLAGLAAPLRDLPVLAIAAYRSDEIPRSIRCAGCGPSCGATGCCVSWSSSRFRPSTRPSWPKASSTSPSRRRSPGRCTTGRRACRSSSRSSARRCARTAGSRPARRASSRPATETSRCRRRSATRCCFAPPGSRPRHAPPRRRPPSPDPASSWTSWRRSAALPGWRS